MLIILFISGTLSNSTHKTSCPAFINWHIFKVVQYNITGIIS